MKSKIDIINETYKYYTEDTDKRGLDAENNCVYKNFQGKMCAVGRCINWEKYYLTTFKHVGDVFDLADLLDLTDDLNNKTIDACLLKEYHGHSVKFWQDLQDWHDTNYHWDIKNKTITEKGKNQYQILLDKYK